MGTSSSIFYQWARLPSPPSPVMLSASSLENISTICCASSAEMSGTSDMDSMTLLPAPSDADTSSSSRTLSSLFSALAPADLLLRTLPLPLRLRASSSWMDGSVEEREASSLKVSSSGGEEGEEGRFCG